MENKFAEIQEKFYSLRGKFASGRITEEQFDAALRDLTFLDADGHYWMLGANTGDWYYSEGENWIQGDPAQVSLLDDEQPVDEVPVPKLEQPPEPVPDVVETEFDPKRSAFAFLLIGVLLLIFVGVVVFLRQGGFALAVNGAAENLPTRIVPVTAVAENPLPLPTATPTPYPTISNLPSPLPVTITPQLVLEPTDDLPALTTIPTITPGANGANLPTSDSGTPPESSSSDIPINPSGLAPGVYVTNLQISPNPPRQQQDITFTATFLNTSPQTVGMEWRIVVLDPSKPGRNKDYGQSNPTGIQIPPGTSQFWISYRAVTSGGPCISLQVLPARRMDDNSRVFLSNINGGRYATTMTVC